MDDLKDRTLTIERTLNAPVETVWEAWTNPEHVAKWWAKGMPVRIDEHNFKVGGKWKYAMQMPDGNEFISFGEYLEIVALKKIVSTANFIPMTEGVEIQVLLTEQGETTQFTFNVIHESVEYCQQQEQMGFYNGWGSVFEKLNDYIQTL